MFFFKKRDRFNSINVLQHILAKCSGFGYDCGFTKGQKILFCCYGVFLAIFDKRLTREHPKTWTHGPVFVNAVEWHMYGGTFSRKDPFIKTGKDQVFDEMVEVLDRTIECCGNLPTEYLVNWSKLTGSPWSLCSCRGKSLYINIADPVIKEYFRKRILKIDSPNSYSNSQSLQLSRLFY